MYNLVRRPTAFAVSALLTLAVARSICAQDTPAASAPSTTASATTEATSMPAATAPASQPSTAVASSEPVATPITVSTRVSFNFKDASVDTVLDYLSEKLGFIIKKDVTIDKRITISSPQPVTADEAVDILNGAIPPEYTVLRTERMLRVVTREDAKKLNIPVHFGADPDKIRMTSELITQVIPVGVDAAKLRTDLTPLLNPNADVTANVASGTIIITDTSASIHRVVEIIKALDQHHESVSAIKIFQLKYASATSAATLINNIFGQNATGAAATGQQQQRIRFGGGGGGGFGGFPGFGGGGPGGGAPGAAGTSTDETAPAIKVNASADDRTNTLVVSGPPDTLAVVATVVNELDSNPAVDQTFFIYNLRNGQAVDLAPVLNTLFGNSTSGGTGSTTSTTGNRTTNSTSSTSGGFSSGFTGGSSGGGRGGTGLSGSSSFGSSSSGFGGSLGNPQASSSTGGSANRGTNSSTNALAGQVFVVANPDTNALLITTNSKYTDQVKKIIDELDRPVPQVLIKVLIAEVTHNNSDDIGVEWSILDKRPSGNGTSGGTQFGLASAIASAASTGSPSGLVVQMLESNVTATLKALASTNKLDVLSRPYILASDNQLASMIVGQEVPIISNSQLTDTGQTINSVSYQNVGIILNVTPHINPDGQVILDVAPQVSQLDAGSGVPISSNVTAPIFDIRAAQTRVGIKNGYTIVIGGLMQDQTQETINKFPLLGDIPLIGNIFKHTTSSKTKTELLIFLTPHVAQQPEALGGMTREEESGTKLTPNAVAPGVFQDHMQGMQLGNTAKNQPATQPGASSIIIIPATTERSTTPVDPGK